MMKKYYLMAVAFLLLSISTLQAQDVDFSRLDLETCIEIALENNLTLQRSQANLGISEANLIGNRGQRIPTWSTGASSGYRWGRSINPVTNLFENNRIGNIKVGLAHRTSPAMRREYAPVPRQFLIQRNWKPGQCR